MQWIEDASTTTQHNNGVNWKDHYLTVLISKTTFKVREIKRVIQHNEREVNYCIYGYAWKSEIGVPESPSPAGRLNWSNALRFCDVIKWSHATASIISGKWWILSVQGRITIITISRDLRNVTSEFPKQNSETYLITLRLRVKWN